MIKPDLVTIKVTRDSRRMLRLLAAHAGTRQFQELETILWKAMSSRKLSLSDNKRK